MGFIPSSRLRLKKTLKCVNVKTNFLSNNLIRWYELKLIGCCKSKLGILNVIEVFWALTRFDVLRLASSVVATPLSGLGDVASFIFK